MKTLTCLAVGLTAVLFAGAASAQTGAMSSGSMSTGAMSKMSKSDMKMMDKCKGMDHDMMMKNKTCAKMMKMHPDMMSGDSSMMMKK